MGATTLDYAARFTCLTQPAAASGGLDHPGRAITMEPVAAGPRASFELDGRLPIYSHDLLPVVWVAT
jgi:hypothetical protein